MAPDPVRQAIHTRLSSDATLKALLAKPDAVYHEQAPPGSKPPYVVFQLMSGVEQWVFGDGGNERAIWLVKGICRGKDSTPAEEIDARCKALLHKVRLAVSGGSIAILRESRVSYSEPADGELARHRGGLYRLFT